MTTDRTIRLGVTAENRPLGIDLDVLLRSRDAYLSRLAARQLVKAVGRGAVRASDELFG